MSTQKQRTEKDFWIEMSIREIWTQAHFAELAYQNIDPKAQHDTDAVFSSIHSFLSHCAMVSKLLKAKDRKDRKLSWLLKAINSLFLKIGFYKKPISIGSVLGILDSSIVHKRRFRNYLEHYDEELKKWIRKEGFNRMIGTYNVGPKSAFQVPNMLYVRHYDPITNIFTFVGKDFNLKELYEEVQQIKVTADDWVQKMQSGEIVLPFS